MTFVFIIDDITTVVVVVVAVVVVVVNVVAVVVVVVFIGVVNVVVVLFDSSENVLREETFAYGWLEARVRPRPKICRPSLSSFFSASRQKMF